MPSYTSARSFGYYTTEISSLIQALKFGRRQNLARPLSTLLARAFCESWDRSEFDLIVPVPLHAKRLRQREYNQAELLAFSLAHQIAIPFARDTLSRARPTLPQVGMTHSQRLHNVRDAFRCVNSRRISGRRILLIDDVLTTGATVESASRALLKSGALRVSVLTVARVDSRF